MIDRLASGAAFLLIAALSAGCGRYQPPVDAPVESASTGDLEATTTTRCEDVPPLPADHRIDRGWRGDEERPLISIGWLDDAKPEPNIVEYWVSLDDPTCEKRPDVRAWFTVHAGTPRFENARIVVRPGQDRAYVGYTIIGSGENLYASPESVRAVRPDGQTIQWKHQTATGGPSDIVASGRRVVEPATQIGGDADYFDASAVTVGQTVLVTFEFGVSPFEDPMKVEVAFSVVAAS